MYQPENGEHHHDDNRDVEDRFAPLVQMVGQESLSTRPKHLRDPFQ
jgi:hypothetical protein